MFNLVCSLAVALLTCLGFSHGQLLSSVNMLEAVENLGQRFEEIRKYGLGADVLEVRY